MKTKIFTLFLALLASIGTMFAERVKIDDLYYNLDASSQTAVVTSELAYNPYWNTHITVANIPSSVTYNEVEYSVTSIGEYAFGECTDLTSVTISNSVISIGRSAFEGCSGLATLTIPNSVTNIGRSVFKGCTGLTSMTIPKSITSLGFLFSKVALV